MKRNFTYKGLARLYFIMRVLAVYLILLAVLGLPMLKANPAHSQSTENTFVKLNVRNASLEEIFRAIEAQTNFMFIFSPDMVEGTDVSITLDSQSRSVSEVLSQALVGTSIAYRESGNNIVFFLNAGEIAPSESRFTNTKRVNGTVKGSAGEVLPGVNIVVKGTSIGTSTDTMGEFALEVNNEEDVLVFSFIGFKNVEMTVGTRTVIDIVLIEDVQSLATVEVRSTGYWTDTKAKSTGNIAKVTSEDIQTQPVTSPLMALQGRMAGVEVSTPNGMPGNAPVLRIRGQNSFRMGGAAGNGNLPLYVIDGVPIDSRPLTTGTDTPLSSGIDPLSTINPANIDNIQILKDADATAIYGSRGANGVVLITTKSGTRPGKTGVDIQFSKGVGNVAARLDLLNTRQYLEMRREAFSNANIMIDPQTSGAQDLIKWDTTRYTDWQEELFGGTAQVTDAQVAVSSGTERTSFRFGAGYHKETLVFPGDFGYNRVTGSLSLNHTSYNSRFRLTMALNYGIDRNRLFNSSSIVSDALRLSPNAPPLYDEEGKLNWAENTWTNPLAAFRKTQEANANNFVANSTVSYAIIGGLSFRTNFGYTSLVSDDHLRNPMSSYSPLDISFGATPNAVFGNNKRSSWIVEPQLIYTKKMGTSSLNAVIGSTFQESEYMATFVNGQDYASDLFLDNIRGAKGVVYSIDDYSKYRYSAMFARVGYDLKGRYLFNLTGRRDGSSRFGPGKRFANFAAFGAAWIFSNETFIQNNVGFLTFGKIRGSYGSSGSDQIGDYKFYDTYNISMYKYQDRLSVTPTALFNPDYAWERTRKLELALEIGFFNDRIFSEISWYQNRSSNQLVDYQLPAATGFTSVSSNLNATIQNTGLEVLVRSENIIHENMQWSTSINFSLPRNELSEYPGFESSPYKDQYVIGKPLTIVKFYKYEGVDPETGLHRVLDYDNNGILDDKDRIVVRNRAQVWQGGISNNLRFRSWGLTFLLHFVKQYTEMYNPAAPGRRGNQLVDVMNRWRPGNELSEHQLFSVDYTANVAYANYLNSDGAFADASFLRLRSLELSYTFPVRWTNRIRCSNLRMYAQGQNLFTITRYNGLDPETRDGLPQLRMVSVGVQAQF